MTKLKMMKTKADILKGLDQRHEFTPTGYDVTFQLRELRDSEFEELEAIEQSAIEFDFGDGGKQFQHMNPSKMGGVKMKKMDLKKIMEAEKKSKRKKIAYSLSTDEEWTVEEVKSLPTGVVNQLVEKINKINAIEERESESLEFFRDDEQSEDDLSFNQQGPSVDVESE